MEPPLWTAGASPWPHEREALAFVQTRLPNHEPYRAWNNRWEVTPWAEQEKTALRMWLLDRLEDPRYRPEPAALTSAARLAAQALADPFGLHERQIVLALNYAAAHREEVEA